MWEEIVQKYGKWHELEANERLKIIREKCGLYDAEYEMLGRLTLHEKLWRFGESPISFYEYPLRIASHFKINNVDYFIPMVIEEASVVAGASYGAKIAYKNGGIESKVVNNLNKLPVAGAQIQLLDAGNIVKCALAIESKMEEILKTANKGHEHSTAYDLKLKDYSPRMIVAELYVDTKDAMGAAVAVEMAEAVSPMISKIIGCKYNLIAPNNLTGRLVKSKLKVAVEDLRREVKGKVWSGEEVKEKIVLAYEMAELDRARATTHNKGIMNGITAVANATCQDTRAIERANIKKKPLSKWYDDNGYLYGELKVLIPCGIVGGEIEKYPKARLILDRILQVKNANQLAKIIGAAGLAQNLAALSMATTIGISKGHEMHR